jgi:branched-chain amino acid transport system permease protein
VGSLTQICVQGLALGAIYALVALSINVVVLTTGVVNFAQGDIGMMAVMFTIGAHDTLGFPIALAVLSGLGIAAATAAAVDLVAVRPVERLSGSSSYGWMVSTLGASIMLQNGVAMIFGTNSQPFPEILPSGTFGVGGSAIAQSHLGTIVITAVAVAVLAALAQRTQAGRAARAIADNRPIAGVVGVRIGRVRTGVVMVSGLIVGLAAVLIAPQTFANSFIGTNLLLNGFVGMVLGGIGNIVGGLVGGLSLGLIYALSGRFAPPIWQTYIPFVVLIGWISLRGADSVGLREGLRALHSAAASAARVMVRR